MNDAIMGWRRTILVIAALAVLLSNTACNSSSANVDTAPLKSDWHEFQGTWTAAGSRTIMRLGSDRRASISNLTGSLLLAGASKPAVGFRAEAIIFNDSTTGISGRAVWTDERGEQIFSELRSAPKSNDVAGTFVGGTGRYAGATGTYEFAWRFLLQQEDGTVQGQADGLKGSIRVGAAQELQPGGPQS